MSMSTSKRAIAGEVVQFRDPAERQGFAIVPLVVLQSRHLKMAQKLLYTLLRAYAGQRDYAWPGQREIATVLGVGRRTVRTGLGELDARALITVERRGFTRTNRYWIEPLGAFAAGEQAGAEESAEAIAAPAAVLSRPQRVRRARAAAAGYRAPALPEPIAAESAVSEGSRIAAHEGSRIAAHEGSRIAAHEGSRIAAHVKNNTGKLTLEQQHSPAPVRAGDAVVAELIQHGVRRRVARALAADYSEARIQRQLDYLPYRLAAANPAGVLVDAIREDWPPPSQLPADHGRRQEQPARTGALATLDGIPAPSPGSIEDGLALVRRAIASAKAIQGDAECLGMGGRARGRRSARQPTPQRSQGP